MKGNNGNSPRENYAQQVQNAKNNDKWAEAKPAHPSVVEYQQALRSKGCSGGIHSSGNHVDTATRQTGRNF